MRVEQPTRPRSAHLSAGDCKKPDTHVHKQEPAESNTLVRTKLSCISVKTSSPGEHFAVLLVAETTLDTNVHASGEPAVSSAELGMQYASRRSCKSSWLRSWSSETAIHLKSAECRRVRCLAFGMLCWRSCDERRLASIQMTKSKFCRVPSLASPNLHTVHL